LSWPSPAKLGKLSGSGSQRETFPDERSEGGSVPLRILEDRTLPTNTTTAGRIRVGLNLLGILLLCSTPGCRHERYGFQEGLTQRILPPPGIDVHEELPPSRRTGEDASGGCQAVPGQSISSDEVASEDANLQVSAQGSGAGCDPARILTLPEAIETAFRQQPRLRVYLESVEQARRGEDIAIAPFLPMAVAGYSVGGFDLNVGGTGVPLGPLPGVTFIPALGSIPIGLEHHDESEVDN